MSEAAAPRPIGHGPGLARVLPDERLARRAAAGDQRAFAAIFRRYHQSLYRFCLAIVGNPDDAQDALQNTMAKVLRALPGEERTIELKPWLYRIAHNESIDLLRRRRETRQLDVELAAPGPGLAEDAEARERLRRLIDDLGELPERQREVLVMRELSGLDFEEIGAALGTSGAVARQTLYEARQSLRQMEEGREMSCEAVTRALSDGDGRVIRRRDVRAHLRACPGCRRFRDGIEGRQRDFAALAPLPAAAAASLLHGLLGGHGAGGGGGLAGAVGGGAAKTIGASAALKGAAAVAIVAAIGAGAADRSGLVHLGISGGGSTTARSTSAGAAQSSDGGAAAEPAAQGAAAPRAAHLAHPARRDRAAGAGAPADGRRPLAGHSAAASAPLPGAAGSGQAAASAPSENPQGHPRGRGHEKRHPAAAQHGQQTASAHLGGGHRSSHPRGHGHSSHSAHPLHPSHPAPAPHPAPPPHPANPEPKPSTVGGEARSEAPAESAPLAPAEAEVGTEETP